MKKPLISIITPTYNRADLLSHAINSVINQKQDIPFDWEMLIVDDWSTDTTSQVVEEYIKKYPQNIKYFYQKIAEFLELLEMFDLIIWVLKVLMWFFR